MKKHAIILYSLLLLSVCPQTAQAEDSTRYLADGSRSVAQIAAVLHIDAELTAAINGLSDSDCPNGLLTLPCIPQLIITVHSGDTLYALAAAHGVTAEELRVANGIAADCRIFPGQQLVYTLPEEDSLLAAAAEDRLVQTLAADAGEIMPAAAPVAADALLRLDWPLHGTISSLFGQRGQGMHYGLDIAADSGAAIAAAADGIVREAGWRSDAYGYALLLDHGSGCQTLYAHCSELLATPGQSVSAGDPLALVGSTGNSTGPHLHFEVRLNGQCTDPLGLLPQEL